MNNKQSWPSAKGRLATAAPSISDQEIRTFLAPFRGVGIAESYRGPSGITADGIPWVLVVTHDKTKVKAYRQMGAISMMGWRWNVAPSCYFSLTIMGAKDPRPHARWMQASDHPVVQSFLTNPNFKLCLAHPEGLTTGWFDVTFADISNVQQPSTEALAEQWNFPEPGIPGSTIGLRFDPMADTKGMEFENQVPLWVEPISDFWSTMHGSGPWSQDLTDTDKSRAQWGRVLWEKRSKAAGWILALRQLTEIDGRPHLIDADGVWTDNWPDAKHVQSAMRHFPKLRTWIMSIAGPDADAKAAHLAAVDVLRSPLDLFALFDVLEAFQNESAIEFREAWQSSLEAALLDTSITDCGRRRPWMKNGLKYEMELHTIELAEDCPAEDLGTLYRSGLTFADLIDGGMWFGPRDLPAPRALINEALESVKLDGSIEDCKERMYHLLHEAREARQWSIPWGAHVQISFGPFVAMQIFEISGEFSCHFLDEKNRYLHICIGLHKTTPDITGVPLVRKAPGSENLEWNEDAEASLQLIAAAIIRDFLVVEDRSALFSVKTARRQQTNAPAAGPVIVYLPRVHYHRMRSEIEPIGAEETKLKAHHAVAHHLRRAGQASAEQKLLAQRYGVSLPEGFTFVRPHARGIAGNEERCRLYRSRSASVMLFDALSTVPEGSRPAWFDFEKDCARWLAREGMRVVLQAVNRDGDGGVDLFAVDVQGQSWVVQCKCYGAHRAVGPSIVRELIGAMVLADAGGSLKSKGILVTTSTFTQGALNVAEQAGVRTIAGVEFARQMADLPSK